MNEPSPSFETRRLRRRGGLCLAHDSSTPCICVFRFAGSEPPYGDAAQIAPGPFRQGPRSQGTNYVLFEAERMS